MDTLQNIQTRRSVRQYTGTIVPDDDLTVILTAAMNAPSAMNKQPWEFFVIRDKDLLAKITEVHPYANFVTDAGTAILVCENTATAFNGYGPIDVALASENLMLAAHELGYGTCFCGVWPEERIFAIKEAFDLPDDIIPIGLIALGTPAKEQHAVNRFDETKIHLNQW